MQAIEEGAVPLKREALQPTLDGLCKAFGFSQSGDGLTADEASICCSLLCGGTGPRAQATARLLAPTGVAVLCAWVQPSKQQLPLTHAAKLGVP